MKHIYDNQDGNHKSVEEHFIQRFKDVANSYEPDFEPSDWSVMQSKLNTYNEKDRKKAVIRRLVTFATMGAAAMILLFGGYKFLNNSANIISKQNSNQDIAFQDNSLQKSKLITPNSTIKNEDSEKSSINFSEGKIKSYYYSKSKGIDTKINTDLGTKNQITQNNFTSKTLSGTENNRLTLKNSGSDKKLGDTKNLITSLSTDKKATKKAELDKMLSALKLQKINFDLFENIEPNEITLPKFEINETLIASNQNVELIRKNPVVSAIGKWRIGAALMAMTNMYKNNDKQRMNYAIGYGIMADYQIAKRFNISAGAVYTQKRINLEQSIVDVTNSFNPNLSDISWVKRNKTQISWQLIDLPIHLRYNAMETKRNKWFVSAGTSNYFFLKENYESDYTVAVQDIYDPRLSRTQEVVSQRETQSAIQLFATINVSLGLETSLGKHLTLQVEPYWRFPVRSLGSEGVFVQTGGLLTRINFAL